MIPRAELVSEFVERMVSTLAPSGTSSITRSCVLPGIWKPTMLKLSACAVYTSSLWVIPEQPARETIPKTTNNFLINIPLEELESRGAAFGTHDS